MQALFADESDPGEAWAIHHRLAALRNHRKTSCDMSARRADNHPYDLVEGACRLRSIVFCHRFGGNLNSVLLLEVPLCLLLHV